MQPHPRATPIKVDQTAIRLPLHPRHRPPNRQHPLRDRGPSHARRVLRLIAIAAPVRHPAQPPGRRHPDRHLPPARRHRADQRRCRHNTPQCHNHRRLRFKGNQPRIQPKAPDLLPNRSFSAITSIFHHLARDFRPQARLQHPTPLLIYARKPDMGAPFGGNRAGSHWDRGRMPHLGPPHNIAWKR